MNAPTNITVSDLPRRKFTAADVQGMLEAGILSEDDKVELIDGELVEMAPQGDAHWSASQRLVEWFMRRLPDDVSVATNGPLRLDELNEPEPDLFLFPAALDVNAVRGADTLLVVEIAFSSQAKDLKVKAPLYAARGVKEYWVIDVAARKTWVFAGPSAKGYPEPKAVAFDAPLEPPGVSEKLILAALPGLAL